MHRINDECPTYVAGLFRPSQLDIFFIQKDLINFGHFTAHGISNFAAIYGIYDILPPKKEKVTYHSRNFSKYNEQEVNEFALTTDWSLIFCPKNVEDKIIVFLQNHG